MTKFALSDLTFIRRTAFTRGDARGVTACVYVTICRGRDGTYYLIPEDPNQRPLVRKLLTTGWI